MNRPPHVPDPEQGPWWVSDAAVLLVCIAALLVIVFCGGCSTAHAPAPPVKPGPVQLLPNTIPHKVDPADFA
jgi:hypothetical protein